MPSLVWDSFGARMKLCMSKHDTFSEGVNLYGSSPKNRQTPTPLACPEKDTAMSKASATDADERVSIVLSGYSCQEALREALESISRQTHASFEVVIVAHPEVLTFARTLKLPFKCRLIDFEFGEGLPTPRELGLQACTAPYVAYLERGDFWPCHHLGDAVAALRIDSQLGLVFGLLGDVRSYPLLYTPGRERLPLPSRILDRLQPTRLPSPLPKFDSEWSDFSKPRWTISCVVARKEALQVEAGKGLFLFDNYRAPRGEVAKWGEFLAEWRVGDFFDTRPMPIFEPSIEEIHDALSQSLGLMTSHQSGTLVQAVFLVGRVFRKLVQGKQVSRAARNRFFDYAAALVRCGRLGGVEAEPASTPKSAVGDLVQWPDEEALPLEGLSLLCESFEGIVDNCSHPMRPRIIKMHFKEKLDVAEIAHSLGMSERVVTHNLRKGIRNIQWHMDMRNPRVASQLCASSQVDFPVSFPPSALPK